MIHWYSICVQIHMFELFATSNKSNESEIVRRSETAHTQIKKQLNKTIEGLRGFGGPKHFLGAAVMAVEKVSGKFGFIANELRMQTFTKKRTELHRSEHTHIHTQFSLWNFISIAFLFHSMWNNPVGKAQLIVFFAHFSPLCLFVLQTRCSSFKLYGLTCPVELCHERLYCMCKIDCNNNESETW